MRTNIERYNLENISDNAGTCLFDLKANRVTAGRQVIPLDVFFSLKKEGYLTFFGNTGREEVWFITSKGKRLLEGNR